MRKSPFFWAITQMKNRIPTTLILVITQVCHAILAVYFALGTSTVVDSAVSGNIEAFCVACLKQGMIVLGILICLSLVRHLREWLRANLERDWKRKLLHGLLHGVYADVANYHSAELVNRLNGDVAKVNDGVVSVIPGVVAMVTRLICAVVVLRTLDGRFAFLMVLAGILVFFGTAVLRRKLKELDKQVSRHNGRVSGMLQEAMEKLLMVQAMDVSNEVERRTDMLMEERYYFQRKRKNASVLFYAGINVLSYGAGFLALAWCANGVLHRQMTVGTLMAIIHLVSQMQAPVVNLSGMFPQYIAMTASAERLMEIDHIQREVDRYQETPEQIYEIVESIQAKDLSFCYDRDTVIRNAEFVIPKNQFVAITGATGAGKSSILKLLLGVIAPQQGELCLYGGDKSMPIDRRARGIFAYVPQGNMLFSGSIRDNLTIVKPDATEEEVQTAVYVSCVDEFLTQLPQGLDTMLGENGAGLSEGQVQRIAIARAVLGGAPILLLDECTSALDEHTEQRVLSRIKQMPNRTCVAVTHRHAAIEMSDWQMVVRDGTVEMIKSRN